MLNSSSQRDYNPGMNRSFEQNMYGVGNTGRQV